MSNCSAKCAGLRLIAPRVIMLRERVKFLYAAIFWANGSKTLTTFWYWLLVENTM